MSSKLLRSSSSAIGCSIIRRLQGTSTSAPSSAYRALNCYVQNIPNNRSTTRAFSSKETVTITYCDPDGTEHPVEAEIGKHLLDVAHDNNIELEGACGGELACSTCHLVFEEEVYDTLPPKSDEEEDMLDLAFELTETSRLGCQIRVVKEFDGIKVRIPDDGY
mmetsp:Transcript_17825/g.27059  ORF Transcript_17825/g.27059 Transcript_17825/m.27059 type:complete len:163 (-) Transcript_17825:125-613(-)